MFMRNAMRLGTVAIAIVLAVAVAVPAAAGEITVGQFVQQLARAKNLNATDAKIAADSLAATGVRLPSGLDYSSVLTEGDVTSIARSAGLNVRTTNPGAVFDSTKADRFFSSFDGELRGDSSNATLRTRQTKDHNQGDGSDEIDHCGDRPGNNGNGKGCGFGRGKGKGKGDITPSEPD
jgi:hypothetical protein